MDEQVRKTEISPAPAIRKGLVWFVTCVLVVIGVYTSVQNQSLLSTINSKVAQPHNMAKYGLHHSPSSTSNKNVQEQSMTTSTYLSTVLDNKQRRLSTGGSEKPTFDFTEALASINKITNLIYQRFEFHNAERYQFFLEAQNMPTYGWDLIKYKLALKLLSPPISDMNDINNNTFTKEYLMIFGGSSVTAGHDNYYNQSYPFVFERRMKDIMKQFGLDLVVHNIAQGSNNCRPSDYCYEAMGGDNPDWISWEQSFNCGRSRDIMEMMARIAYWNKAVIYYVASGAFLTNGCAKTTVGDLVVFFFLTSSLFII